MKNIKKNTLKAMALIVLFCPAVFADGDMGGGGFVGTPANTAKPGRSVEDDGDMGGGGRIADPGFLQSALDSVYELLDSMI